MARTDLSSQLIVTPKSNSALNGSPDRTANKQSSSSLSSEEIANTALKTAIELKAHDCRGFDVTDCTDIADYFIVASATSQRHAKGIADKIIQLLKASSEDVAVVSGYENGEWIVLDYGNVIVHVLYEPLRQYYNLDELWRSGTRLPVSGDLQAQAKLLETGMYR